MIATRLIICMVFTLAGIAQCTSGHAATPPPQATSNKVKAAQASKAFVAQIKAKALKEARAQLVREDELKARARLEAIQELSGEVAPEPETAEAVQGE